MYKKLIITGCPRTGTTGLAGLLSSSKNALVTNELATFHPNVDAFYKRVNNMNEQTSSLIANKGWDCTYFKNFVEGKVECRDEIELFGDKHPDYSLNAVLMSKLIKNHSDAYFIFTYRDPCSTLYSFLKRSRVEVDENAAWYVRTHEEALNRIIAYNLNWSTLLYPMVSKRMIIDYNKYINNPDLLVKCLESFLGIKLEIQTPKLLYSNNNSEEWKRILTQSQISNITRKFEPIKSHIDSLCAQSAKL